MNDNNKIAKAILYGFCLSIIVAFATRNPTYYNYSFKYRLYEVPKNKFDEIENENKMIKYKYHSTFIILSFISGSAFGYLYNEKISLKLNSLRNRNKE